MDILELASTLASIKTASGTWTEATKEAYSRDYRKFLAFLRAKGVPPTVENVTKPLVEDYMAWLSQRGNKPVTVQRAVRALKALFVFAVERKLANENPCAGFRFKRDRTKKRMALTDEQCAALLADDGGYEATRNRAIIAVLLTTGLRRSELLDLRWDDIDFDRASLTVRETKGRQSRDIHLGNETIKRLREHFRAQPRKPDGLVFTSRVGRRMSKTALLSVIKRAAKRAGLDWKKLDAHTFRHNFITRVARELGLEVGRISAGHADIATTIQYVHPAEWEKRQVPKVFDALFASSSQTPERQGSVSAGARQRKRKKGRGSAKQRRSNRYLP